MKIVTYNIQYGKGADGRFDLDRTVKDIAGADIIAIQEIERFWERSGNIDEVAELAERLSDYHWVFAPGLDVNASFRDQEGTLVNRRRQFGVMLLSKTPILSSRSFLLPKYGTLTQHSIQQVLLEGVIETSAGPIRVYTAHLSHLAPETRIPQIKTTLDIINRAPAEGGAWCGGHPVPAAGWTEGGEPPMPSHAVLMGDLNFVPGSAEYDMIAGPMSPHHGRLSQRNGFLDTWVVAGHMENDRITSLGNPNGKIDGSGEDTCIDYCFVTAELSERVRGSHIDNDATGSDHLPVWVDIDLDNNQYPLSGAVQ